eukprot:3439724-Pleurochrysis_carterae.AAC.1
MEQAMEGGREGGKVRLRVRERGGMIEREGDRSERERRVGHRRGESGAVPPHVAAAASVARYLPGTPAQRRRAGTYRD